MKYVLCRTTNGLNDMFNEIVMCYEYAKKFNRTLIVDSNYKNSLHFRDKLSKYFVSKVENLILDAEPFIKQFEDMSVYPKFLEGKINNYELEYSGNKDTNWLDPVEKDSKELITFDFTQNYEEDLLVFHLGKLIERGHEVFNILGLSPEIKDEFLERRSKLPKNYIAVHIRNTDRKSRYESLIRRLRVSRIRAVFLATDGQSVVSDFKKRLGERRVFNFTSFDNSEDRPLHEIFDKDLDTYQRNVDAIVDLLLLVKSTRLLTNPVLINNHSKQINLFGSSIYFKNGHLRKKKQRFSGYSILAMNLRQKSDLMNNLLD